jgi:hypothetical protein
MKISLKYPIIIILALLLLLTFLPLLFKDKLITLLRKTANDNLNAVVYFDNSIEISLIRNFPNLTLGIKDLCIAGINEFEGDTLFSIQKLTTTIDLMSIIKGDQINIITISLVKPNIFAKVLSNGQANWDITKSTSDTSNIDTDDTTSTKFNLNIKRFEIIDAKIIYNDIQSNTFASIIGFNHSLRGDFTQDNFLLNITNTIEQLTINMAGITYLNNANLSFNAGLNANTKDMRFEFQDNELTINALKFAFDGWVEMPDESILMNINFKSPSSDFKNFISLIPTIYANDFENLTSSGSLAFDGFIKGEYSDSLIPQFKFNLNVKDGMFKYPELPMPVSNVQIDFAAYNNATTINDVEVNLSRFHLEIGGDALDATFFAKNLLKDPSFSTVINGNINLDNIAQIVPLDKGGQLKGQISTSMKAEGLLSTIENQKYEQFDASGDFSILNFYYNDNDMTMPLELNKLQLVFTPKVVKMPALHGKFGNSDFSMQGELSNFFAYALSDGILKATLTFNSNLLDANQFLSVDEVDVNTQEIYTDTSVVEAPQIPSNIDFRLNSNIKNINYTNLQISNFVGQLIVNNGKLYFKQIKLNTLGALVSLDGYYHALNHQLPQVDMDFNIRNLDIHKAFVTFNTVQKIAPVAENMSGIFNAKFKMSSSFDKHLNVNFDSLQAFGLLEVPNAKVSKVKVFEKTADLLRNERFRELTMSNVRIEFAVKNGRIYTQPFDLNIGSQKLTLTGSTGLDQTIDYIGNTILPKSALGSINTGANSLLDQINNQVGTSIRMSDNIPIQLVIKGTFSDPKISTNLSAVGKSEADNLKSQLLDEVNKRKQELEAKARAEAERLKLEAQQQVDKARTEAEAKTKAEADRIKREAEERAKAEQERLKREAEEEAKKRLRGVLRQ